jgi:outer membrane protein OmpA-like peptidoglycan-associated protein
MDSQTREGSIGHDQRKSPADKARKEPKKSNERVRALSSRFSGLSNSTSFVLRSLRALWPFLVLSSSVHANSSSAAVPKVERYVACPVYRDTDAGRKSGCWLATDLATGIQYDVTDALIKPILGREILVEGIVTQRDQGMCNAPILEPVSVSVLATECKGHVIPAENATGRKFALPPKTLQPTWVERKPPPPPYTTREYTMYFELNSDFLLYQHSEVIIDEAVTFIRAANPKRVVVTAYADTAGFTASGRALREQLAVAEGRAKMLTEALLRLGIPKAQIVTQWRGDPAPDAWADSGLIQASKRRAVIRVEL